MSGHPYKPNDRVRITRDEVVGPSPFKVRRNGKEESIDTVHAGELATITSITATCVWLTLDRPTGERGPVMVRVEAPFDLIAPVK